MKDLLINESGDLEIGPSGDIACVYDDDVTSENIIFRLKTYTGDYSLRPNCGAGLEDFIGKRNTRETGEEVRAAVVFALTHDGFINSSKLEVDTAPLSASEMFITIRVEGIRGTFTVMSSLDLLTGKIEIQTV